MCFRIDKLYIVLLNIFYRFRGENPEKLQIRLDNDFE